MKHALILVIAVTLVAVLLIPNNNAFAETWYYYVEPLPDYASYANNVLELSTTAWEDANSNLEFIEVETWEQANFRVLWVKEFGVEHVGYAVGNKFIEVGLGDSNCGNGMWQPFSEKYVRDIMTHEIGHILGKGHVNDPNDIMYPIAINWEYGNVGIDKTLTNNYGYFQPICTSKDIATFDWYVSSDDIKYGFDVYFVSSIEEFDNWVKGESFSYFNDEGCFAENMISVGGMCEGVTQDSGLFVIMGENTSEPLTEITINFQENYSGDIVTPNESIESGEDSSTIIITAIPISTPTPNVITTIGTSTLSKTTVELGFGQSEQVKVNGIINNVDKVTRVNITYTYPDMTTNGVQVFTTETGVYETVLDLEVGSPKGVYEILVTSKGQIIDILELTVTDKMETHPFVEVATTESEPILETQSNSEPLGIVSFVDESKDPQSYVDRYNNEVIYKEWFDENYPQYSSIYEAVGLAEPIKEKIPLEVKNNAEFPDPDKDPKDYLIRYYTEPKYQEWFDTNFPNESIEDKVGYPYKIVTDEYYVDTLFDFSLKNPSVYFEIDSQGNSVNENVKALTSIYFGTDIDSDTLSSGIAIYFAQNNIDEINYDDLLYYYSNYPESSQSTEPDVSVQMKITNEILENDGQRDIIRYELSTSTYYPDNYFLDYMAGQKINSKDVLVIFLYPNGDEYELIFTSDVDSYAKDVKEFDKMVDSFYVGKTQNLSDIINTNISNTTTFEESNVQIISEPEYTPEPTVEVADTSNCGAGTESVNGICQVVQTTTTETSEGGGCLIATATYGSELAPQVQQLREIRDNSLLTTESGTQFMSTFNDFYYSFSPVIADYERENPIFKELVKIAITPMVSSLSILNYVDMDSESSVLGYGISLIILNGLMYVGIPIAGIIVIRKRY